MSLYRDFLGWQERLAGLLAEGDALARRIEALEQENLVLRQGQRPAAAGEEQPGGFETLSQLYDEGYHICPMSFGQAREEDCLFCLNFLRHKGKRE